MLKFKHSTLIVIAGLVWLAIGIFLLNLGLKLIVSAAQLFDAGVIITAPLLSSLAPLMGSGDNAGILVIAFTLAIGYFKGRFVLVKSAQRAVNRIISLPSPTSLHRLYSPIFLLLIAVMISLGVLIRVFNVPGDIRGGVDVAIGSALISGSLVYFRLAARVKKSMSISA